MANQHQENYTFIYLGSSETSPTAAPLPQYLSSHLIVYILIGCAGMLLNALVVVVLMKAKQLRRKTTNMFIVNQSVIDFFASLFLVATSMNNYNSAGYGGLAGEFYCRIWEMKVPMWSLFMSSTYNLVALTTERYLQVIHPIKHKTSFGEKQAIVMMAMAWLIGPVYNFPLTGLTSGISPVDGTCLHMTEWPSDNVRHLCGVLTFILEFALPLFVLVFCYARMIGRIRRKIHPKPSHPAESAPTPAPNLQGQSAPYVAKNSRVETMGRVSRNLLKTLILVSVGFFLCWVWNQVFFLLFNTGYPIEYGSPFYHFTVYAAFLNSCLNPGIYIAQYHPIQKELLKCCSCEYTRSANSAEDPTVTHDAS